MPHHFLVLGATGPSGITFLTTALSAGHAVTIYARNPAKLPQHIRSLAVSRDAVPKVTIFQGGFDDSEESKAQLEKAICSGADCLVSFAGPAIPARGTAVAEFYAGVLFPLLLLLRQQQQQQQGLAISDEDGRGGGKAHQILSRVLVLSTPSFRVPEDSWSLKWRVGVQFVYWFFGSAFAEVVGIGDATVALSSSSSSASRTGDGELEWTVFRVPVLTNGKAGPVRAGFIGEKGDGMVLSREAMAVWLLQEVEERRWVGRCPAISNAGGWI